MKASLPLTLLRAAIVSVKVFGIVEDEKHDSPNTAFRRQMALHSLAVACFAERIAEQVLPPTQRQTAYLAGLLHDIGKCALDEVMPKSFSKMIRQARSTSSGGDRVGDLAAPLRCAGPVGRLAQC